MNQAAPLKTRNRRAAGNRAPAIRGNLKAERPDIIESQKALQANRIRHLSGCSLNTAYTLAFLAYGEGRHYD